MAGQNRNTTLSDTSFLDGANAAYLEALQARYEKSPESVDADWRAFFDAMAEGDAGGASEQRGASWKKEGWPILANGEIVPRSMATGEPSRRSSRTRSRPRCPKGRHSRTTATFTGRRATASAP